MHTWVMSVPDDLADGLLKYGDGDVRNAKFLLITGGRDYLRKRIARSERAERQKQKAGESK